LFGIILQDLNDNIIGNSMPLRFYLYIFFTVFYFGFSVQLTCRSHVHCPKVLSQIVETDQLDTVKSFLDEKSTLVIFDIDNTLVTPYDLIGTEQWFVNLLESKMKEGLSLPEAKKQILPLYYEVHNSISVKFTEPDINLLFEWLMNNHILYIALTARSDIFKYCSNRQLNEVGLKLPFKGLDQHHIRAHFENPVEFDEGVIYCGSSDKGDVLFYMLDQVGFKPEKIIFVDDRVSNLLSVQRVCLKRNIPFIGLRYSRLDGNEYIFDSGKSDEELKKLLGHTTGECLVLAQKKYGEIY